MVGENPKQWPNAVTPKRRSVLKAPVLVLVGPREWLQRNVGVQSAPSINPLQVNEAKKQEHGYHISSTEINSLLSELNDEAGGPVAANSVDYSATSVDDTGTFTFKRQDDGTFLSSDISLISLTEFISISVAFDSETEVTRKVPIISESTPVTAPIPGWSAYGTLPLTVTVDGDEYLASKVNRRSTSDDSPSPWESAWVIFNTDGTLLDEPETRAKAALAATTSSKSRQKYDEEFLREWASYLRESRDLANISTDLLYIRDLAAQFIGVFLSKNISNLSKVTYKKASKQALSFLAKEIASDYVNNYLEKWLDIEPDSVVASREALREFSNDQLGKTAQQAENAATILEQRSRAETWSHDEAITFWELVSYSLARGALYRETRINLLPDADMKSQFAEVSKEVAKGATPTAVDLLISKIENNELDYFSEAVKETADTRARLNLVRKGFEEFSSNAQQAGIKEYGDTPILERSASSPKQSAKIDIVELPEDEYMRGESVVTTVAVTNTGETKQQFFIGYGAWKTTNGQTNYYDNQGTTGHFITVNSGETVETGVKWIVDDAVQVGETYGVGSAVWSDFPEEDEVSRLAEVRKSDVFQVVEGSPVTEESLQVKESDVATGEPIEITVTLANSAGTDMEYLSQLQVETIVDSRQVVVPSNGEKQVTFTHTFDQAGEYVIESNDQSVDLNVIYAANIDVDPDTLNKRSGGKWVTAYIELPDEDASVEDISISSISLNGVSAVDNEKYGFVRDPKIEDRDGNGLPELMVKFHREEVEETVDSGDNVETVVSGEVDDLDFEGTDTITVKNKGKGKGNGKGNGNNNSGANEQGG